MKRHNLLLPLAVLATSLIFTAAPASAQLGSAESNLVKNGNFELMDADGRPEDWIISHPNFLERNETQIEVLTEQGKTFYRATKHAATGPDLGSQKFDIPAGTENLRIAARIRGQSITRGSDTWHLPGLAIAYFYSDDAKDVKTGEVGKWITIPTGDSEWRDYESIIPVRDGAPIGNLSIIGHGWSGTMDITDIVVEAID